MTRADHLTPLTEDLSGSPDCAEIRDAARRLVEAGIDPKDVVDALFTVAAALSVHVDGPERTAFRLLTAGRMLHETTFPSSASH